MGEITSMAGIEVWTIQMAQWRKAKELGIELIDTTVKSGKSVFAPTWEMVMDIKNATPETRVGAEELYTRRYHTAMQQSWKQHAGQWLELLSKERVAIACYCKPGVFCHRHLLIEYLGKVAVKKGIPFIYKGEL